MNWTMIIGALIAVTVFFFAGVVFFFERTNVRSSAELRSATQSRIETGSNGIGHASQEICVPLTPPPNIPPTLEFAIPVEGCRSNSLESYKILPIESCPAAPPPPTLAAYPGFVLSDACPAAASGN